MNQISWQGAGPLAQSQRERLPARVARGFDLLRSVANAPLKGRPSAARERLRREALELVRSENLLNAAYSYRVVALDAPPAAVLCAGGEQIFAPWLLPAKGELTAIACCVCTVGEGIETRVKELFAKHASMSLALALDDLGNELLLVASRRAQDRLLTDTTRCGFTMAGELRAGDPGLALDAQDAVLRLAGAAEIGVTVTGGHFMHPLKSTSLVMGVGIDLPPSEWSRCDTCPSRDKCGIVEGAQSAVPIETDDLEDGPTNVPERS